MNSNQQYAISELIASDKLENLDLHSGIQYEDSDSTYSPDDVLTALQYRLIDEMQILNPIDEITVSDETTLFLGQECYFANALHYDGNTTRN
jgi:hypothetical protein